MSRSGAYSNDAYRRGGDEHAPPSNRGVDRPLLLMPPVEYVQRRARELFLASPQDAELYGSRSSSHY